MDRQITLDKKICFTLEAAAAASIARIAGVLSTPQFLLEQFSTSVWAYPLEDGIRLVTKPFVATGKLIPISATEALLSLGAIEQTMPREVTMAFREGQKIVAEWEWVGETERKGSEGAWLLWRSLRGEEAEKMVIPPVTPVSPLPASGEPQAPKSPEKEVEEEPVLPQSEIDRLIASLKAGEKGAAEGEVYGFSSGAALIEEGPSKVEPPGASLELPGASTVEKEMEVPTAGLPGDALSVKPDSARMPETQIPSPSWNTSEETPSEKRRQSFLDGLGGIDTVLSSSFQGFGPALASPSLRELLEGRPYSVVVFGERKAFEDELASFTEKSEGSLMAFWAGEPLSIRLGPKTRARLEELRATFKGIMAFHEKNKARLRSLEEILPHLKEYREEEERLALEAVEVAGELRMFCLNQVMQTEEGRSLARKIFAVEARRQSLMRRLAAATYKVFRRSSLLARSRFAGCHARFLLLQRELESWGEKLSLLEREVRRRLEYQADWRDLINKQIKIQRKREEIARLLEMAAQVPQEILRDPEAIKRWLSAEWESLHRREELLLSWQDYLQEEKAWIARTHEEPFVIFGDRSLLSLPGLTCGAHLVMVAAEGMETVEPSDGLTKAYELSADWLITDATLKVCKSGQGFGQMRDPLSTLAEELARRMGIDPQEALHALGLLGAQKADGYYMGVV
ncbi:MAG: hypothetical protein ACUVRM_09340 [Bacillota bacterium]